MKFPIQMLLLAVIFTLFNGCTQSELRKIADSAIADVADTEVKHDLQTCVYLQQRCAQGDYQERQTSNKVMGCWCKKR
jgi:hypothetical protein